MHFFKKSIATISLMFLFAGNTFAIGPAVNPNSTGNTNNILNQILTSLNGSLYSLNRLPSYLQDLAEMADSWMHQDDSDFTSQNQANFSALGQQYVTGLQNQSSLETRLMTDLLGGGGNSQMPYANDLTFSTLLGNPILNPDPRIISGAVTGNTIDPAYNYIKNASGFMVPIATPSNTWRGSVSARTSYTNVYKTLTSVQSFNAYILGKLYLDYQQKAQLKNGATTPQMTLIQQATASDWFKEVASAKLGIVLRQILMFDSQTYVLLSQMLETQKQLLAAQAMTNALLILQDQNTSGILLQRAQGTLP